MMLSSARCFSSNQRNTNQLRCYFLLKRVFHQIHYHTIKLARKVGVLILYPTLRILQDLVQSFFFFLLLLLLCHAQGKPRYLRNEKSYWRSAGVKTNRFLGLFSYLHVSRGLSARRARRTKPGPLTSSLIIIQKQVQMF